jgi:hypothetical protein
MTLNANAKESLSEIEDQILMYEYDEAVRLIDRLLKAL